MKIHPPSIVLGAATVLAAVGLSVLAQEAYTVPPTGNGTAQQQADLTAIVAAYNANTCEGLKLATSCTQAQACTAANAAGGASCTAAQARAANARIWPNTTALERSEFVTFVYATPSFNADRIRIANRRDYARAVATWAAASVANRNAVCTAAAIGLANGCDFLTLQ